MLFLCLEKCIPENFNRNKHLVVEIRMNQNMAFCMVFWGGQGDRVVRVAVDYVS